MRTIPTILLLTALLFSTTHALDQASADALAAHFLSQLNRSGGGIASLPAAGDGMLAQSIVQSSRMWVHAMSPDNAGTQTVLALLEPTSQVGKRCWVEKGTAAALPYADNLVDLVAITNLTDAGLSNVSFAEIMRSLNPGGKAFVGRAAVEGGGLSSAALTTWVNARSGAVVTTDAQGTWAVLTKAWPAGRDEWTHTMHGPDNNPVSSDSSIKWPYLPQWRQKPYACSRGGGIVTSVGRAYLAVNLRPSGHPKVLMLIAYRVNNGCPLWSTVLDPHSSYAPVSQNMAPRSASFMVACPEGVWVQRANQAALLGGEDGATIRTITFDPSPARWVKWMALSGGLLYGLVGDSTVMDRTWTNTQTGYDSLFYRHGNVVAAYDAATGAQRWRKTLGTRIDSRDIGIANGKLFYYARRERVGCVNAATGDSLWSQSDAAVMNQLEDNSQGDVSWTTYPATGFLCSPYGVFACDPDDNPFLAFSATDGHVLWTATKNFWGRMTPHLILGTTLVNAMVSPADRQYVDLTTGLSTTRFANLDFGNNGCGVRTASPDGFFSNYGGQTSSISLNRNITPQHYKTDCGIGAVLSDGMFLSAPAGCQCEPVRGTAANIGCGGFVFDRPAVQSERLEAGPAMGNVVAQVQAGATDWWTHRANAAHSGYVAVDVASSPHLVCGYRPAAPYDSTWSANSPDGWDGRPDSRPTPPVVAGSLVFWGGTDGYVRCFDITLGRQVWSYLTGGAVRAEPTVSNGCAYVGSEDGYAYCLEAHTARLVWRFRGAPVERRINLYGHMASSWPVNSGITIAGNNVVFAAGMPDNFGTHVYALDARSGAIVWQNNASGAAYNAQDRVGVMPCGYGIAVKSTFWQRASCGRNGIFSLGDGSLLPLPSAVSGNKWGGPSTYGAEMALLDSTHVIYGGRLPNIDQVDRLHSDRKRTLVVQQADAQGNAVYPEVVLAMNSLYAAWDNQAYVAHVQDAQSGSWIERWSTPQCIRAVDSIRQANATQTEVDVNWSSRPTPMAQWSIADIVPNAIALARNAVVMLSASWVGGDRYDQSTWKWYLCLLARDNVDTLWSTQLPCEPVQGGVAISRSGDVVVALTSGAILCYGSGTVSVAQGEPAMPLAAASPGRLAASTVWEAAGSARTQDPSASPVGRGASPSTPRTPAEHFAALRPLFLDEQTAAPEPVRLADASAACRLSPGTYAKSHGQNDEYAPRDMRWTPGQPCLAVSAVRASSSAGKNAASNSVDHDLRTRWSPSGVGSQWLAYDLGSAQEVAAVSVVWYAKTSTRTAFSVETSLDGKAFAQVDAGYLAGRGTSATLRSFMAQQARFVRLSLRPAAGSACPSVYEVGIHGDAGHQEASAR